MKKMFMILVMIFSTVSVVNAVCSIDDPNMVCSTSDSSLLREPYKPIYHDYSDTADLGGAPFIRLAPVDRSDVERTFKDHNDLQNIPEYSSNCQFGVCLPTNNSSNN